MTRKFQVTHPDGTVSKRTSKNRVYPYAVAVGPADPNAYADRLEVEAAEADVKAIRLDAAAERGTVTIRSRGFAGRGGDTGFNGAHSFNNFMAVLDGTRDDDTIYEWCDSTGRAKGPLDAEPHEARTRLIERARTSAQTARNAAHNRRKKAADLRGGDLRGLHASERAWGVVRWTSRYDLALAYISGNELAHHRRVGCEIQIVPTKEVVK